MSEYFGGTGVTLSKLCKVLPIWSVDGTRYKMENWIKEVKIIDSLVPGVSKIWIPYGGAEYYGTLKEVVWKKIHFEGYGFQTPESKDWWFSEPYMLVDYEDKTYYIYEYTFYKKDKHKVRRAYADKQKKPKRKFLSQKDIADIKKEQSLNK